MYTLFFCLGWLFGFILYDYGLGNILKKNGFKKKAMENYEIIEKIVETHKYSNFG